MIGFKEKKKEEKSYNTDWEKILHRINQIYY